MLMTLLAIVVALAACGSKNNRDVDCSSAGDGVKAYWENQAAQARSEKARSYALDMLPGAAERMKRHCVNDGWSAETVECMRKADHAGCEAKLTPEQLDKLKAETKTLTEPHKLSDL
jgi:hypothetical protein